jgi:hypothetical protein
MLGLQEHGDLLSFCFQALTPGAKMLQLGTPEFQPFDGVFTGRRQGLQGSIWQDMPMPVVIVFRLTGIQEAIAARMFFRTGPALSLVFIAFPAAPVEVRVRSQEVGTGMWSTQGAVVINGAASFTADEVFMDRNYSAGCLPNSEGCGFYCGCREGIKGFPSKASRIASKTFLEFLRAVEI